MRILHNNINDTGMYYGCLKINKSMNLKGGREMIQSIIQSINQ